MKRILLGLIAALMGGALLWWTFSTTSRIRESAAWPTADGEIFHSAIVLDSTRIRGATYNRLYRADIRYRYQVDGKPYESDVFTFGIPHSYANRNEAEAEIATYAVGRHVEVRYDPSDPKTSSLRPGTVPDDFSILMWMAGAFALAGVVSILSGVSGRRKPREVR